MVGKNKMKNWKSSVSTWQNSDFNKQHQTDLLKDNTDTRTPEEIKESMPFF